MVKLFPFSMKSHFTQFCFLCLVWGIPAYGLGQTVSGHHQKPNILFIMTDDHACRAVGAYGGGILETPGIDRLAKEGVRFERAFVTNGLCSPSRAVILTGKHSHLNGVRDNADVFDSAQVTFPKLLRQQGYATALIGKWHLKSTPSGFDYWKVLPDQGSYYHPEFITPHDTVKESGYVTDVITDMAMTYLDSARNAGQPFMLMLQHKAPHREWWPAMRHLPQPDDPPVPEPETLMDDYSTRTSAAHEAEMRIADHMALSMDNKILPEHLSTLGYKEFLDWYEQTYHQTYLRLTDEEKRQWDANYLPINADFVKNHPTGEDLTRWKYQRFMTDYLGTIRSVDENIEKILYYLDTSGLAKNTLVIYTSDQGFFLGEHGWFDKRFMYEPAFRTPLLMRWPGHIQAGTISESLVQNLDIAPTILDAAQIAIPKEMQGTSLLPIFKENNIPWRKAVYYHYYEYPGIHMVKKHEGVRTDRYKLIHFYGEKDEWEFYDLEQDPEEIHNIYGLKNYKPIQNKMHRLLKKLRREYAVVD